MGLNGNNDFTKQFVHLFNNLIKSNTTNGWSEAGGYLYIIHIRTSHRSIQIMHCLPLKKKTKTFWSLLSRIRFKIIWFSYSQTVEYIWIHFNTILVFFLELVGLVLIIILYINNLKKKCFFVLSRPNRTLEHWTFNC